MTTTSRCRNRLRINSASNRPHNSAVIATHEPGAASTFIVADRPGPSSPASHPTTASSTTVTATAGPRSSPVKTTTDSATSTTVAVIQPTPVVCSGCGNGRWPPGRTPAPRRTPNPGRARRGHCRRPTGRRCPPRSRPRPARRRRPCEGHELDLDAPEEAEAPHPDHRRRLVRGGLSHRDLLAAEQREPADVDLDAVGHEHVDVPERRDGVDRNLAGGHGRLPEIEVDVAEHGDRRHAVAGRPGAACA